MMEQTKKGRHRVLWGFLYAGAFVLAFAASAVFKMTSPQAWAKDTTVAWSDAVGTVYTDISYGDKDANKFDLYVPADSTKQRYGLVVYLHAGGFTTGDKADDTEMLQWICSKGYVAAGINYTLRDEAHPDASVYSQSMEIKESIPYVIAEAEKLGYSVDEMVISGGSAGGCLALLYAYRDADTAPVPVKAVISAVGPSSFYPEDWSNYGFDQDTEDARQAAAGLFGVMAGKEIQPEWFGTERYDAEIKDISALLWVKETSVPTLLAYGAHDRVQPYQAAVRLDARLTQCGVPHDFIVFEHSGHGLQNDNTQAKEYSQKFGEYLDTYLTK